MDQRTFLMTGPPRSGTTYLSAVLHDPPRIITVSDPAGLWKRYYTTHGKSEAILEEIESFRAQIVAGEPTPTLEGTPGYAGQQRVDTWNQKKRSATYSVAGTTLIGFKNPEIFLDHLEIFVKAGIPTLITVRHPEAVISSWKNSDPRRPLGFANGDSLIHTPKSTSPIERRIDLLNHMTGLIIAARTAPNVLLIRYEDWFENAPIGKISDFLSLDEPFSLIPPPIKPGPVALEPEELALIRKRLAVYEDLGYQTKDGALLGAFAG